MEIPILVEGPRGCGYRKPGGLYLVSGELSEPCPLLPVETSVCPTCGEGIRPARGFTWVDAGKLVPPVPHGNDRHDLVCPLSPARDESGFYSESEPGAGDYVSRIGRAGLIWIGEQFYPTPRSFLAEAAALGVSRRISAVPREFKVGETWVLLGHRKAIEKACPECGDEPGGDPECPVCEGRAFVHIPGVITAFQPRAVEYVVKGDETEEELEALVARGLTPVRVEQAEQPLAGIES